MLGENYKTKGGIGKRLILLLKISAFFLDKITGGFSQKFIVRVQYYQIQIQPDSNKS